MGRKAVPGLAQASHAAAAISEIAGTTRTEKLVCVAGLEAGADMGPVVRGLYGRNPSKIIWSAQRARRRSDWLRTVQVNSGKPNAYLANSGAVAGRSRTE